MEILSTNKPITSSECLLYTNEKLALLNIIQGVDQIILEVTDSRIVEVLLYGRKLLDI